MGWEQFRVMYWQGNMEGPWTAEAVRRFHQGGYDGLTIRPTKEWNPTDLEFLRELDGLRMFHVYARIKNDLAAFNIATLEYLSMLTGAKRKVPEVSQPNMSHLLLNDRPGITVHRHWPQLRELQIGSWKGTDLSLIAGATGLTEVHLEGRRQEGSLDGIQDCTAMQSLTMDRYCLGGTGPLRGLNELAVVKLSAEHTKLMHSPLDLSNITSPKLSRLSIHYATKIVNIDSLTQHPVLREVNFRRSQLSEKDMSMLALLPRWVDVHVNK